jgi:hypothetical protein
VTDLSRIVGFEVEAFSVQHQVRICNFVSKCNNGVRKYSTSYSSSCIRCTFVQQHSLILNCSSCAAKRGVLPTCDREPPVESALQTSWSQRHTAAAICDEQDCVPALLTRAWHCHSW